MSYGATVATVAFALIIGLLVGLIVWAWRAGDAQDARDARSERQMTYRADHVCDRLGGAQTIEQHNASWSFGPYIEVVCRDGSAHAIR